MKLLKQIFDIFFTHSCYICKESINHEGICNDCWKKLKFITNPKCKICGYPFEFHDEDINKDLICLKCLRKYPKFDKNISSLRYNEASKNIIIPFKHSNKTILKNFISEIMISSGKELIDQCDFIIPIPIHFKRLIKRKYNQSALLAHTISKKTKKKYLPVLKRIKFTESQGHLTTKERIKNVKNNFEINKKYKKIIIGKTALLIDDVITTGATINECARVLKNNGFSRVLVLTFCKVC